MAKNLLIDTCVWRELISPIEFSVYLKQLINWCNNDQVTLYCPAVLKKEWEKHRGQEEKRLENILKKHQQDLKKSALFSVAPDISEPALSGAEKTLKSQLTQVDKLFNNSVQIIDETVAAGIAWKHQQSSMAPFIRKEASHNDAVLIFATLDELKRRSETELFFLSSNHTDFGAPYSPNAQIHDDIAKAFPEIQINYFSKFTDGFKALIDLGLPSTKQAKIITATIKALIPIDSSKSVLDQLYDYLNKRFDDIRFLPKKLFCLHKPFINNANFENYSKPFTANTDNLNLFQLFKNLHQQDGKYLENVAVSGDEDKITVMLNHLRGNLVHLIAIKDHEVTSIPYVNGPECECPLCLHRRFKMNQFLQAVNGTLQNEKATLKKLILIMW